MPVDIDEALIAFGRLTELRGPTVRDLGAALGLSSTSPVALRIQRLVDVGYVEPNPSGKWGGYTLTTAGWSKFIAGGASVSTVTVSIGQSHEAYARALAEIVAPHYGVPVDAVMHSKSPTGGWRTVRVAYARQIVMWRCREEGWGWKEIADIFGLDHSTVCHGWKKVQALRAVDDETRMIIASLPPYQGSGAQLEMLKARHRALESELALVASRIEEIEHPPVFITRQPAAVSA